MIILYSVSSLFVLLNSVIDQVFNLFGKNQQLWMEMLIFLWSDTNMKLQNGAYVWCCFLEHIFVLLIGLFIFFPLF